MFRLITVLLPLLGAAAAYGEAAPGTGLQIAVAGDIVGLINAKRDGGADNRLEVREGEVLFYAPIDHLFDGVASAAAHQENGVALFEVHELYLGSTKLIPRSRFRIGQFFLGFGRLTQFHRHDWPFTSAPKYHTEFWRNGEGVLDTGAEYSYLLPIPFYLDLTAGITNGWTFGHSHNIGKKPQMPTHYLRLATYNDVAWGGGIQTGLNYVGRTDELGDRFTYLGVDTTAKWREASSLLFLFQSEVWMRMYRPNGAAGTSTLGFYVFPQYGISPAVQAGVRFDGYTVTNLGVPNFEYAVIPSLTYKASEFSTLRAGYNFKRGSQNGVSSRSDDYFEIQAVFILGSHPAHDF